MLMIQEEKTCQPMTHNSKIFKAASVFNNKGVSEWEGPLWDVYIPLTREVEDLCNTRKTVREIMFTFKRTETVRVLGFHTIAAWRSVDVSQMRMLEGKPQQRYFLLPEVSGGFALLLLQLKIFEWILGVRPSQTPSQHLLSLGAICSG